MRFPLAACLRVIGDNVADFGDLGVRLRHLAEESGTDDLDEAQIRGIIGADSDQFMDRVKTQMETVRVPNLPPLRNTPSGMMGGRKIQGGRGN